MEKKFRKKHLNLPFFGSKTPFFGNFSDFLGFFSIFRPVNLTMCKAWLDAMTEYWFFWKKYRKFRIVIFPEMGPCPHLLTLWSTDCGFTGIICESQVFSDSQNFWVKSRKKTKKNRIAQCETFYLWKVFSRVFELNAHSNLIRLPHVQHPKIAPTIFRLKSCRELICGFWVSIIVVASMFKASRPVESMKK